MRSTEPAAPPELSSLPSSLWGPPGSGARPLEALVPGRVPWATLVLGGVQLALFLGERAWGGLESSVALYRMGAARGPLGTEAWRLVSAGFVFRDGPHWASHLAALLVGGLYVEGLLGPSRLVLLYVTSLGVSLAACVGCWPDTLVAGSSGGLWGLAGALLVLACHPRVPLARPYRVAPLVAAFGVGAASLRSAWAPDPAAGRVLCLSGAAVGLGLALSGVLTWRVPRYVGRLPYCWRVSELPGVRRGAWGVAVLTALCLVLALMRGRPWELRGAEELVRRSVPGTPVSVAVPVGARPQPERLSPDGESVTVVYGETLRDSLVVTVSARRLERAVREERLEAETQALRDELRLSEREPVPTQDVVHWTAPSVDQVEGRPVVFSSRAAGPGDWSSRWVMYRGRWRISLEVRYEREAYERWSALAERMARNVDVDEP